ncbi:MAG: hypothetical protein AB7O31_16935, partial [Burkholderiales bacterium]
TMKDGKKVISDRPMPGAVKVEELKLRQGNYAPGAPAPAQAQPSSDTPEPKQVDANAQRSAKAKKELAEAQRAYDEALAKQEKGKEEGPGDRIGTVKGGARLSEAYYKRQEALEAEVEAARSRLGAAREMAQDNR